MSSRNPNDGWELMEYININGEGSGEEYLNDINIFFEACEFPNDRQAAILNRKIDGYLSSSKQIAFENTAYRGLVFLLKYNYLPQRHGNLTKNIVRLLFSLPVQYHLQMASIFCTFLVCHVRILDNTIAIVFDFLYQCHNSNPQQVQNIISSCISLLLAKTHSPSDFFQLFQFFLKCTSMVSGFRGSLWISCILFEAISNEIIDKSLIEQLIVETISFIRSQSEFAYERHVVLAVLFILAVRFDLIRTISPKTLFTISGYLGEILNLRVGLPIFLQFFYGHCLSVLMELMKGEIMVHPFLLALLKKLPEIRYENVLTSLRSIAITLSGPLNSAMSFHLMPIWLEISKPIFSNLVKKMGTSELTNVPKILAPYRGLRNPSTICYGNSTIQMLSKIPLFRQHFDRHCKSGETCGDLHKELKEVFDSLDTPLDEKEVDASNFICISRPNHFEDDAQEDAQEYLSHLLDQLQVESTSKTSPASPSYIADTFIGCQSRVSNCATCRWEIDKREETFTTLMLPLEQNDNENKPSIQSMVDSLSRELIEDTPKCEKCGGDDNGVYSRNVDVTFRKAPPCLLLNVKIFYFDMVTGSTVKKMSKFDINDTVTLKLEDGTVQRYQIFGFVLHGGDHASSGHYVWACEMADRWAVFNDEEVEFVDLENILSPSNLSPYILVYTLQKN